MGKEIDLKELGIELVVSLAFVATVVASGGQPIVVGAALALLIFVGSLLGSHANHVNPAVTLGFLAAGKVDGARAAGLVVAQLVGGVIGAIAVVQIMRERERGRH